MNKDIDAQFLCKDCARYKLCQYYDRRKEDSYICKYFHLSETYGITNGQEPRWIPVSERLPEAGAYVGNVAKYYLVQNEYGDMLVARYTHSEYWEQMYQIKPHSAKIVAWMPLPEPYKAESEDVE